MRGKDNGVAACIDVGSGYLRMVIAQTKDGQLKPLESLRKPLWLGRDIYATGRVSVETLAQACEILKGFVQVARAYGIKTPISYATSAIREAANRETVLDRIRLATTLEVEVLSNAEERLYDMLALPGQLSEYQQIRKEGVLVTDIGYGGIQMSYINKGEMRYSRHERLGALRLWEMSQRAHGKGRRAFQMLEEYIRANTNHLRDIKWGALKHGVALFGDGDWLLRLCGASGHVLTRESVAKTWRQLHDAAFEDVLLERGVPESTGEVVLPALMLLNAIFSMTSLQQMQVPTVGLCEGVLTRHFSPDGLFEEQAQDILSYAIHQRQAYNADAEHSNALRQYASTMFDSLTRLHGLSRREKMLLELACIMHEVGRYVASADQYEQSALIVEASPPPGLSHDETLLVSALCRNLSSETEPDLAGLPTSRVVDAVKLLAMLRAADALDASHTQKLKQLRVDVEDGTLRFRCDVEQDFLLEQQAFESCAELLAEAFGVTPELQVKRVKPQ